MNKAKNRGFSLVELLIAIAILSIIMVMISGFVSSTLISQRKTKKNMQMQTEAQRIYYQLSEIIMQATYIRVQAEDGSVYDAPAPKGELKNGVGAGDSMVAGFMAGWMEKHEYRHAFHMGVASGSASAFSENLATKEEIAGVYQQVVKEER